MDAWKSIGFQNLQFGEFQILGWSIPPEKNMSWDQGPITNKHLVGWLIYRSHQHGHSEPIDVSSSSDAKKAVGVHFGSCLLQLLWGAPSAGVPGPPCFFSLGFWEASSLPMGLPLLDLCSLKIGFEVRPSAPPTSSAAGDIEIACANYRDLPAYHRWPFCYGHRITFPSLWPNIGFHAACELEVLQLSYRKTRWHHSWEPWKTRWAFPIRMKLCGDDGHF